MTQSSSPSIKRNARRLLQFLTKHKGSLSPLLILTHDYPDPDALASGFALYHIAKLRYNINVRLAYGGIIGRTENKEMVRLLRIPFHKFKTRDLVTYTRIALVDTQPEFENNPFPPDRKATIIVDQHPSLAPPSADLAIIDDTCGATSVILAQALLMLKQPIPQRVATACAYGIITDTLNLYRAKRPEIIKVYQQVLPFCDMHALARIQNPSRPKRFFSTLEQGIRNVAVRQKLIVSHLGIVESPDLVSQVADFLLSYRAIRWAFCTGRFNGRLHLSFRATNPNTLAAKILRDVVDDPKEAGGHETIAGGSILVGKGAQESVWKEAETTLVKRLMERLRLSAKSKVSHPFRLL
jgi:nanoRNase/pAp phosphatase (c-di-AMP/oligoRNAs hydrolase)